MRAVGYVRVSTDEQAGSGVSLEMQIEKVRQYAELHGLGLLHIASDPGESAKNLERPGLKLALGWLSRGEASGLIVVKLDRLTRSVRDLSHLIERYFGESSGRSLMSVMESIDTGSAAGRMVLNLMTTIAQWERETIVERTQAAMDHKRSRNERIGQIPFGKRLGPDGRTLVDDSDEIAIIKLIRDCYLKGMSYREIALTLNSLLLRAKNGGEWCASSVRSVYARSIGQTF